MQSDNMLEEIFNLSLVAAQTAGKYIYSQFDRELHIDYKGRTNMVTQVDREAESRIITLIQNNFPDHRILAEESQAVKSASPYRWIIDPLDGTTNFIHGFPVFAVSIAVEFNGEIITGVVYDPSRNELFSAIKNGGAYLNKRPIKVSGAQTLSESLTATGFPYETDAIFELNMEIFHSVYRKCRGVRRAGSAALDMCYIAAGRFDGFWELGLNPWDISAGALIIQEAGGIVGDFSGRNFTPDNAAQIIATNGKIHTELLGIIQDTLSKFKDNL